MTTEERDQYLLRVHAERGFLVIWADRLHDVGEQLNPALLGPFMKSARWRVCGEATLDDLRAQAPPPHDMEIVDAFLSNGWHLYRIEAMD